MSDRKYLTIDDPNFKFLFGGLEGKGIHVAELDGGFVGTSVLIEGYAGTGKTILACQLCTHALNSEAFQGTKGVIYSLDQRPEELGRLICGFGFSIAEHIATLEFNKEYVDPQTCGNYRLFVKHVAHKNANIGALWQEIQNDQRRCKELKIVVVDTINSLLKLRAATEYAEQFRGLIELSRDANLGGLVLILTLESVPGDSMFEEYVPNCVIQLSKGDTPGLRRSLEVKKIRNQQHYIGTHDFDIGEKGIFVFPSLHARSQAIRVARTGTDSTQASFIPFGYLPIDEVINPGLARGSTTLLWGAPGTFKTNLSAKFLLAGLAGPAPTTPQSSALFVTFKIDSAAFRGFLRKEVGGMATPTAKNAEARTTIIEARDPFELPTSVFTRIMQEVARSESEVRGIERAVVFGLRRLYQLPAYRDSEWPFLEVLVSFLQSHQISTLLVDWPEEPSQVAPPMAIDLCASEIKTGRQGDRVLLDIRRKNYELVGKIVDYG